MAEILGGIPCGYNPDSPGQIVDGNTCVSGEVLSVLHGDLIFGSVTKLDYFTCETLQLTDIWKKYKDKIPEGDCLYIIETNALTGTIYACGHTKLGEWTVFATTAGYA